MSALRFHNSPAMAAVLLIITVAALSWFRAIPSAPGFSFDDREAIVGNPVVEGSLPAGTAFERDYWHHLGDAGHYRPLATLLLRWDHGRAERADGSLDPAVFRRTNVALHIGILLLLGAALLRFEVRHGLAAPWFGFGLFALHPASADVVAWISGRTSLVSGMGAALGILLATFTARDSTCQRALAIGFASGALGTGLALLGKEDGLVLVVALPVAAAWCGGRRAAAASAVGCFGAAAAVAALRAAALGTAMPEALSAPLAHMGPLERVGYGLAAWWDGLLRLVSPWVARPPSLEVEDLITGPGAMVRALCLLLVGTVAAGVLAWRARRALGAERMSALAGLVGLCLIAACIAPLVQLVPAGEIFAPRFLYQPLLLGMFTASGLGGALLSPLACRAAGALPAKAAGTLLQALALVVCAALIPGAAGVYASRASYWEAHLPVHADEARVWNALGNAARETGQPDLARTHFEHAAELDPNYSRPRTNLGTLALAAGDLAGAERWLREAVATGPENPNAHANLGNLLLRSGKPTEAVGSYRNAVAFAPGRGSMHRGLARALYGAGRFNEAKDHAGRAIDLDPADDAARRLLDQINAAGGLVAPPTR